MVQVRGIEDRLFPRTVDSYNSPRVFMSLTLKNDRMSDTFTMPDRIFETLTPAVDVKERTLL